MKMSSWMAAVAAAGLWTGLGALLPARAALADDVPLATFGRVHVMDGVVAIESCVSDARIVFGREDLRVVLDDDERQVVHTQLMQRYPAAQRVGVDPTHLVLWQQAGGSWLYVALLQHPRQADRWCFTASFVAGGVERTTALLRKYFALRAA
jgi:hypothetical protein